MTTTAYSHSIDSLKELIPYTEDAIKSLYESPADKKPIDRIEIQIPKTDIQKWFALQNSKMKLFWSDRTDCFKIAGIEYAEMLQNGSDNKHTELFAQIKKQVESSEYPIRYFGGMKFDASTEISKEWKSFGSSCFILPRFEMSQVDDRFIFSVNFRFPSDGDNLQEILQQLHSLNFDESAVNHPENALVKRFDFPDKPQWIKMIEAAVESCSDRIFNKIVLARKTELRFQDKLDISSVFNRLYQNSSNCFHFCFQLSENSAFMGATPERLYFRNIDELKCEAIAGTTKRSLDPDLDVKRGEELLSSDKNIKEHQYVIDSILEAFDNLKIDTSKLDTNNVGLVKLKRIQHLIKRFNCKLNDSISDFDLIDNLHPTAAVGGYPKKDIRTHIYDFENFDRGWYAAPIGWISKERAEFAVAIRSGLISNERLNLYSGAGIIADSQPELEWDEIETKISNFLKTLS
ncbi:MAG: isochorismate synthase [Calditrichaeota bacterium]|nr:MAG: isochorismate synthase [Calditrichota bacterium]